MTAQAGLRAASAMALFLLLCGVAVPADPSLRLCGFHWLTGHPCPLCGMTRAMFALAKGQWSDAVHFNALSPLGFAMVFAVFCPGRWRDWLWGGGAAAFAVYGVWRLL